MKLVEILVEETDEYLYHGTTKEKLPQIKQQGLSSGHLTKHLGIAAYYADRGRPGSGTVLRVRRDDVSGVRQETPKHRDEGQFLFDGTIPPHALEVGKRQVGYEGSERHTTWKQLGRKR